MVHAGLLPQWTPAHRARAVARSRSDARERPTRTSSWASSTATSRADGATTSTATTGCASSSTRARGCASAPPTARWSSREKRGPRICAGGIPALVRARHRRSARRDDRLRPLVDARPRADAERADARFGLLVGRYAYRDPACRTGACIQVPSRQPVQPKPPNSSLRRRARARDDARRARPAVGGA